MYIARSLFTASLISASALAQSGVIPPPPSINEPTNPAAPIAETSADLGMAAPNALSPEEKAQGWRLLFDGMKLISMRGVQKTDPLSAGWKIEAGELKLPKDIKDADRMTGGDLITTDKYYDFDFRFEWKATVAAESGVRYLISTESIGKTPDGLEYQVIDDVHNSKGLKGGGIMRSSSLEGILAPSSNGKLRTADPLQKQGDPWNEGRIVVQGTRVQHWLNGEKVLEFDLGPGLRNSAAANGVRVSPMWGNKSLGKIALLDQGTEVSYRNLKIRVLTPTVATRPGVPPTTTGGTTPPPAIAPVNPYLLPKRPLTPK
jgi:hypothetical protein